MAQEIETKILKIDKGAVAQKLVELGAEQIQDTKLIVDWFRPSGIKDGEDPWFLRIRTDASGKSEVTWKSKPDHIGISKQVHEINFPLEQSEPVAEFFQAIGFEKYAHQEKFRISWKFKNWRFDLDQYPGMSAYLEIEGDNEAHLKEAIELLGLSGHKASSAGERLLIQNEYKLDWHNMKF